MSVASPGTGRCAGITPKPGQLRRTRQGYGRPRPATTAPPDVGATSARYARAARVGGHRARGRHEVVRRRRRRWPRSTSTSTPARSSPSSARAAAARRRCCASSAGSTSRPAGTRHRRRRQPARRPRRPSASGSCRSRRRCCRGARSRANARLLLDVNRRRARRAAAPTPAELLAEVGLADFADAYPHELSGGMQQRVALVRAMALGAPLLLMDEPFAALDEITRADMRHLLARLCEQLATTVLFVTHSIAESVFISDRVVVLSAAPGPRSSASRRSTSPGPATPSSRTTRRSSPSRPACGPCSTRVPGGERRGRHRRWPASLGIVVVSGSLWELYVRLFDVQRVHPAAAVDDPRRARRPPPLLPRRGRS